MAKGRNFLTEFIAADVRIFPGSRSQFVHEALTSLITYRARGHLQSKFREDLKMNISVANYEELLGEFSTEINEPSGERSKSQAGKAKTSKSGSGFGRRRGKSPQQFNGIHRRRRKNIKW